tara:strand:- start:486 stop:1169 length:684 start_codon:yes stop_codon:yes gene_type:complete
VTPANEVEIVAEPVHLACTVGVPAKGTVRPLATELRSSYTGGLQPRMLSGVYAQDAPDLRADSAIGPSLAGLPYGRGSRSLCLLRRVSDGGKGKIGSVRKYRQRVNIIRGEGRTVKRNGVPVGRVHQPRLVEAARRDDVGPAGGGLDVHVPQVLRFSGPLEHAILLEILRPVCGLHAEVEVLSPQRPSVAGRQAAGCDMQWGDRQQGLHLLAVFRVQVVEVHDQQIP